MKKVVRLIVLSMILVIGFNFMSCNDKDGFEFIGEKGRPRSFEYPDKSHVSITYEGSRISEIISKEGAKTKFVYENGILDHLSFSPPEGMMDGHGKVVFKREQNKIRVESTGEPSSDVYVEEIELDESDLPVRITEIGIYEWSSEGLIKKQDGSRYTQVSLDPVTKSILERKDMKSEDDSMLAIYNYEYDNNPGAIDKIDCPVWFWVYWNCRYSSYHNLHTRIFYNYVNNVTKETIKDTLADLSFDTIIYDYTYNEDGYPVTIINALLNGSKSITIRY